MTKPVESSAHAATSAEDHAELRRLIVEAVRASCPERLRSQAEDLAQQALVKLLARGEGLAQYVGAPRGYLRKLAHSIIVDELRARMRRREDPAPDVAVAASLPSAERVVAMSETANAIEQCVAALSDTHRPAVTLWLQGLERPEIATLLALPAKRADNLVTRGLVAVRRCLTAKGVVP